MGLNDAAQALKKADILKEKVENCKDLLNDGDAWVWQQQLQRIYQQVLLQDLEYALDCKVEQELWNYGFKNYICILQNMVKDKKNPKRTESQAILTWCLEAASGFYLTLLQEICTAFDLDLSCRRRDSVYGISENYSGASKRLLQPNSTSCSYICQHCLVHLGDIARYRNQNRQAESFYRHAVQLSPHSGQPYNQLALLDSSRGDRLGTVFHYVRSVAVRHPFPAAATNLKKMFSRFAEDQLNLDGRSKLSVQEYVALFLKFHGLLYLGANLTTCSRSIRLLTDTLTAQVATESFTSRKLVQMLAINLYALHRAHGNMFPAENEKLREKFDVMSAKLSPEQKHARSLVLDLMAGSLSALLLPVYTIRESEALQEYFALPAVKLTLDWICLDPHILSDPAFTSRLQIWPSLCKLLNGLQTLLTSIDQSNKFASIPLPEDRELHGFLPLSEAMKDLQFNCEDSKMDSPEINQFRAFRLVKFGVWLSKQENAVISSREINSNDNKHSNATWIFEAVASGQAPSSELLRELEQLSLGVGQSPQQPSPSPSDAGSWGGSSTSTPGGAISPPLLPPVILEQVAHTQEKRTGILKPQGSLEKSREKELANTEESGLTVGSGRRAGRQNIAMQTILRKGVTLALESDVKQVSFKTPSPTPPNHTDNWSILKAKPGQSQAQITSAKQCQSTSQSSIPLTGIPSPTNFSQPPPPLQQLQQQAQARVVHVPPPQIFPLPPMSIPPPCIRPNIVEPTNLHFSVPENTMNAHQSFGAWPEESQAVLSDSNQRRPWWPGSSGQVLPQNSISRTQPSSLPVNMYSGASGWRPFHQNQQQQPYQTLPLQQQQSPHLIHQGNNGIESHTVTSPQQLLPNSPLPNLQQPAMHLYPPQSVSRQHEALLNHGLFTTPPTYDQQQLQKIPPDHKSMDTLSQVQGFSPYSLFSANNWLAPALSPGRGCLDDKKEFVESTKDDQDQNSGNGAAIMGTQSLWSGPGPSPLERLLEQQKQLREGPSPKSGT